MLQSITFNNVLPKIFAQGAAQQADSDIWKRNFTFYRGERYLIEAASGTGKTSLCSYIMGLRNDYCGSILFDGKDISTLRGKSWTLLRQSSLAWMPQDLGLFLNISVCDNINLKNDLEHYMSPAEIDGYLERMGIADKKNTPARLLSVGQQQKVAFLRMVCQPADFFLMDEPVSHLDKANNIILSEILDERLQKTGAGLIMTSVGNAMEVPELKVMRL